MDPEALRAHLDDLCDRLDQERPLRVVKWAGVALVASGTLLACGDEIDDSGSVVLYGAAPTEDVCDDEIDDDGDGDVDCDDQDCAEDPACMNAGAYGAPEV
jgi:hypothetical protein